MKNVLSKCGNNKVIGLISSLMVMFALTAKWEIIPETWASIPLADFINRFAYSFYFSNYSDVFVFAGIFCLINKIIKEEK